MKSVINIETCCKRLENKLSVDYNVTNTTKYTRKP